MSILTDSVNAKQLVDLLTSSVIDEEVLDQYDVYVNDVRFGTYQKTNSISIESVVKEGKTKRNVVISVGEQ